MISRTKWITGVVSALEVGVAAVNSFIAIYNEEQRSFSEVWDIDEYSWGIIERDLTVEISGNLQESWSLRENFTEWCGYYVEKAYKAN